MKRDLRIVFMGSPGFAVTSLASLLEAGFNVVGVVTAPDKQAGRGREIKMTDVKTFALTKGLPVLQPENLKDPDFYQQLVSLRPNLGIVVAFRMLPEIIWSYPEYGTFNLHASLLPQYRGAAPINHAIINGESETGLTTFFLKHEIDTGNILFRERIPIENHENFGELHGKLMHAGASLVIKTCEAIQNDSYNLIAQQELIQPGEILRTAPKIFKEHCRINWYENSWNIYNLIRGLSPTPAAFTEFAGPNGEVFPVKVFKADFRLNSHSENPGNLLLKDKKELAVFARDGMIIIKELQAAGKKRISAREFLNGFLLTPEWKMR